MIEASSLSSPSEPLGTQAATGRLLGPVTDVLPGVVLAATVTAAAMTFRQLGPLTMFSPMILAVIVGVIFSNTVGAPAGVQPGLKFCGRTVLRWAIVLLGFQLTLGQAASIGPMGLGAVALTLATTFCFTLVLARVLGVDQRLAELIGAGTSICGASAIVAANSVTNAHDEDVAYAIASITLFGTIAMLAYPLLAIPFGLDDHHYGIWAGASIHEVAQVVGAGFQVGEQAGDVATVAKLSRVAMLAPAIIALGFMVRGRQGGASSRIPIPWFVLAFAGVVALNSFIEVPAEAKEAIRSVTTLLLTLGLASVGLQANIGNIRSRGVRPLLLALSSFVFIACFSLMLVKLMD